MTDQDDPGASASDTADVFALRLIMAFLQKDLQMIDKTLDDLRSASEECPRVTSLVYCSLAARCARVFELVGEALYSPNYALDHATAALLRAVERTADGA